MIEPGLVAVPPQRNGLAGREESLPRQAAGFFAQFGKSGSVELAKADEDAARRAQMEIGAGERAQGAVESAPPRLTPSPPGEALKFLRQERFQARSADRKESVRRRSAGDGRHARWRVVQRQQVRHGRRARRSNALPS